MIKKSVSSDFHSLKNPREDWTRMFKKSKNKLLINDSLDIEELWKDKVEDRVKSYEKGKINSVYLLKIFKSIGGKSR